MELYCWKGDYGLPSVDVDCLTVLVRIKTHIRCLDCAELKKNLIKIYFDVYFVCEHKVTWATNCTKTDTIIRYLNFNNKPLVIEAPCTGK